METNLAAFMRGTADGEAAEAILRKCVHCGFCTATCPTYQILGDELDGPRGRIYLIKNTLEGSTPTASTRLHLDRCLTCRSCETTCPSGVEYGRLLDIGRRAVELRAPLQRPIGERFMRAFLRESLTRPRAFGWALALGRVLRPWLPTAMRARVPLLRPEGYWPRRQHARKMLVLHGCVQSEIAPSINAAAARVLDRLGISLQNAPGAGCCGAIRLHLDDRNGAQAEARRNIDAWTPFFDAGCEALVMTASGCGSVVRDYGELLHDDPAYAQRAADIARRTRDLSEVMHEFEPLLATRVRRPITGPVAFHSPCTLQHGQQIRGRVESVLRAIGVAVHIPADAHLCCGSAGTYSILQPELAQRLRDDKLGALHATGAPIFVTANIGCLAHLQSGTETPVRHWIEYVDVATALDEEEASLQ